MSNPSSKTLPILYSFRRCPFAMRARLAVQSAEMSCALREIVLRNKPEHLRKISPKATVPVMLLPNGDVVDESLDIMLRALEYNDPEHWLPANEMRNEMLALVARCDGTPDSGFKFHLDRTKYFTRYDDVDPLEHRAEAYVFLKSLEARLTDASFLFGAQFSFADAAIAPFVRQFSNIDQALFAEAPFPRLQLWLETFLESPRFSSIMVKHPPWQENDAETLFPARH